MRFALFALTAAALAAQAEHQHHPPRSADEYAKVLEDPARDAWQKPHEVIQSLGLKNTDVVADIGAGSGYFTRRVARHAAHVYAVDIDAALLGVLAKDPAQNVTPVLAAPGNPRLPAACCDVILMVDVLHHIENRPKYYPFLMRALKPGGRLVIIDFHKRPLPIGPPPAMKIAEKDAIAELETAGFRLAGTKVFLSYQYYVTLLRP